MVEKILDAVVEGHQLIQQFSPIIRLFLLLVSLARLIQWGDMVSTICSTLSGSKW